LDALHKIDLDLTNQANQAAEDHLYGDGCKIGKEIDDQMLREASDQMTAMKQLDSSRRTFLDFVKTRERSIGEPDAPLGLDTLNMGHITDKRLLQNFSTQRKKGKLDGNRNESLPSLGSGAATRQRRQGEYSSFLSGKRQSDVIGQARNSETNQHKTQRVKQVGQRAQNSSELHRNSSRSPGTSLDRELKQMKSMTKSPSHAHGQSFLFGKLVDSVLMAEDTSDKEHSTSMFPQLNEGLQEELEAGQNFARSGIKRNSLSNLLKNAEQGEE
jgi:hypothetical protein